jgi:tetratricopeptide (TPR) repeat protein
MTERRERRAWTVLAPVGAALILAGLGAGLAAAFAPSSSWLVRAASAAAGGVAGVLGGFWVGQIYERRQDRAAARRARDDVLDPLSADSSNNGSVFDVLLATSTEAAPFRGRKDDLAWLERWWDNPRPVVVVAGPAGIGKTRLVTEFASNRPAPWASGWLRVGHGTDAVAAIRACSDPALVLVDDADQRPDLAAFLASLTADRGAGTAVRVILITRGSGLASRLAATLDDRSRGMLDGIRELLPGPLGDAGDRARWFGEAVRAYARARNVPPPDLPDHLSGHVTDLAEPILTLHALALLAVLDSEGSRPVALQAEGLPFDQVAAALFSHEQYRWQTSARQTEFGLTDLTSPVQAQAIAALLLARPTDHEQAVAVLGRVSELATASEERRANVARWASFLYPSDPSWPIQIKPDILSGWFAITQLTQTAELGSLVRTMTVAQKATLLLLLAQASDYMPQAVQTFTHVIATDISRLAEAGVAAALTASKGQWHLDDELARLIVQASWSADTLGRVGDQLAGRLPRTRAGVAEARVKIARADGDATDLAQALTELCLALTTLGRYQEALAATEEAVGLLRALAQDNPDRQLDLARGLGYLGFCLAQLGRNQEALAATEEAVGLLRALAQDNPARQLDLAQTLDHFGDRLAQLGRNQEALAATEEAVGLLRALAQDNRARQLDLAAALDDLGDRLARLGRYREGLAANEEAVALLRALARDNLDDQPRLARAVGDLGIRLANLGRYQDALAANEEAVALLRALAQDNPGQQASLAVALDHLGLVLAELGRYHKALAPANESVALLRALARDNPDDQPRLGAALANLASDLARLGRHHEALAATKEAVGLYRTLARDNPDDQPALAAALGNLGVDLAALHLDREALTATEESVGLWRPLVQENAAHQPRFAKVLDNLGARLAQLGRHQEALAAIEEAVDRWKALAQTDPDQYQEIYNREQAQLRRYLSLYGQESASILRHLPDDSPDHHESHHIPPVPNLPEE